ncbi:unnamed protein product [Adineta steineri]|uniref:LITAF domain-containing protein n=1 Tax=Adineta steineri TaxID=433720 RepID=A0A813N172_9BILA|nr:unnamed protein product [Adineta steineri]CAF0738592.1 unnamed protein product [Adineta steineri]CAF0748403.1 unnamed protein product [Adineta steineri]
MTSVSVPPPYTGEKPMNYQQVLPQPVYVTQPVYVGAPLGILASHPMQCTCPHCRLQIVTRTESKIGLLTWLLCCGLLFFGLWPCAFIPFCVDECKDTVHYCPNCSAVLGVGKKL